QLLYFNACTTENYIPSLRDPAKFPGRNTKNTDVIGTTIPAYLATGPDHVLGFLSTVARRGSMNDFVAAEDKREADETQQFMDQGVDPEKTALDVKRAGGTFFESGFVDNGANRFI